MTTFREAIADPRADVVWLAYVTGKGFAEYLAEHEVVAGGRVWRGLLRMEQPPALDVDPYDYRFSAVSCTVQILPEMRDPNAGASAGIDMDAERTVDALETRIYLYRWAVGTDFADEAQLLLEGIGDTAEMREDGAVSITFTDLSRYYRDEFPGVKVTKKRWPSAARDDVGECYPIVYGTFTDLNCPVVNVASGKAVVAQEIGAHVLGSVTQAYKDDAVVGSSLSHTTDGKAHKLAVIDITGGLTADNPEQIYCSGTGLTDDSVGTYTDNPGALLVHPADQLHHFATHFAGVPTSKINLASFKESRALMPGYKFAFMLPADDKTTLWGLAEEALPLISGALFWEYGLLTLRHLSFTGAPRWAWGEDQVLSILEVRPCEREDIFSRIALKYGWKWKRKKKAWDYLYAEDYGPEDDDNLAIAKLRYGARTLSLETRHLNDEDTAERCCQHIAALRYYSRLRATVTCSAETHLVRMFDLVSITTPLGPSSDGLGWQSKRWIVIGIEYGLEANTFALLEA